MANASTKRPPSSSTASNSKRKGKKSTPRTFSDWSRWLLRRLFYWVVVFHVAFMCWTSLSLLLFRVIDPPVTMLHLLRINFNPLALHFPSALDQEEIPADVKRGLVLVEDGHFYKHWGVEPEAIWNAFRRNQQKGKLAYGGSTLTQQTARTLFLGNHKNYLRKYLELIVALEMEVILPKDRILALYLNNIEWGKDVYGLQDAARHYFDKPVHKLTRQQKVRLLTIIASPVKNGPFDFQKNRILRKRYALLGRHF